MICWKVAGNSKAAFASEKNLSEQKKQRLKCGPELLKTYKHYYSSFFLSNLLTGDGYSFELQKTLTTNNGNEKRNRDHIAKSRLCQKNRS